MSEHTQGPWHTGGDGTIIYDSEGWGIANATVFHGHREPEMAQANARRIVACVNACEGIPTELVEAGGFAAIPVATHREVQAQRDALLAALEDARRMLDIVADCASHECEDCREHAAINRDKCAAAIAAAKGGAV